MRELFDVLRYHATSLADAIRARRPDLADDLVRGADELAALGRLADAAETAAAASRAKKKPRPRCGACGHTLADVRSPCPRCWG